MTEYLPGERWAYVMLREDGSLALTSWRFRLAKATRLEAEIALLQGALYLDTTWRSRLRVARYRMPVEKAQPVELIELHEVDLKAKKTPGVKQLLDRKQMEFEERCWEEASRARARDREAVAGGRMAKPPPVDADGGG